MTRPVVITVVYGATERVLEWAEALAVAREHAPEAPRVIAVDNASGDDTVARLRAAAPWIEVIERADNGGFAVGCNTGLAALDGESPIVILNPDVRVSEDFFAVLAAQPWADDLAAIGPQVIGGDGELEQSARGFPSPLTGLFGRTSLLAKLLPGSKATKSQLLADPAAGTRAVDWVSGACLIASRDAFARVGGFDPGYWMYWEDADWCRRAHDAGLQIEYRPELVVHHQQGSSSAALPVRTTLEFHRSAARYYRLHAATLPGEALLVRGVLLARAWVKLGAARLRGR